MAKTLDGLEPQVKSAVRTFSQLVDRDPQLLELLRQLKNNADLTTTSALEVKYGSQGASSGRAASEVAYHSTLQEKAARDLKTVAFDKFRAAHGGRINQRMMQVAIDIVAEQAQDEGYYRANANYLDRIRTTMNTTKNAKFFELLAHYNTVGGLLEKMTRTMGVVGGIFVGYSFINAFDAQAARAMTAQANELLRANIIDRQMHSTLVGMANRMQDATLKSATAQLGIAIASPYAAIPLALGASVLAETSGSINIDQIQVEFNATLASLRAMHRSIAAKVNDMQQNGNPNPELFGVDRNGRLFALPRATFRYQLDAAQAAMEGRKRMFEMPMTETQIYYGAKIDEMSAKLYQADHNGAYRSSQDLLRYVRPTPEDMAIQSQIQKWADQLNQTRGQGLSVQQKQQLNRTLNDFEKALNQLERNGREDLKRLREKPIALNDAPTGRYETAAVSFAGSISPTSDSFLLSQQTLSASRTELSRSVA